MSVAYEKEINDLLEKRAEALTQKHEHRTEWGQSKAQLTVLMARYINSSASFDNKVPMLLKIDEVAEEVKKLNDSFINDEIAYKKYRDLDDLYKSIIMEYQSRRKSETGIM